jgi:hypothetical protein
MVKVLPFLAGIAAGVGAALTLAWGVWQPASVVGDPASLNPRAKEEYLVVTSMAYMQDGDLASAKQRLSLLNDADVPGTLRRLAERYTTLLRPVDQRGALAKLALALGADSVTLRIYAVSPTPTPTPRFPPTPSATTTPTLNPATSTPTPTFVPSATPPPRVSYRLFEQVRVSCDQDKTGRPRLMIYVEDTLGTGMPGVKVRVQWADGQDTFFTGLKNAVSGYAEYEMLPGKSYSVAVADVSSQVAFGLDTNVLDASCPSDGKEHFRAWRVIFRRSS